MVDSRQKGARAESAAKGLLIKHTKLNWQRVPSSGALNKAHKLKGDLYIPEVNNIFCVEVKHYKDDHLTSKVLTDKTPQLLKWWGQTTRQAEEVDKKPLLLFKFDRSKWFVGFLEDSTITKNGNYRLMCLDYNQDIIYIAKLEDWLENEDIKWIS